MKVGTDGVLLGAWTNYDDVRSLLDVGAGSGLISLMAAQKNESMQITAIEIDKSAASQAQENADDSVFKERIKVLNCSFQEFASATMDTFDLIVSNPPFFQNSLLPPDARRTDARHAESLPLSELFALSKSLLNDDGRLSIIYPSSESERVKATAKQAGFYVKRETAVFPTLKSAVKRVLFEFSLKEMDEVVKDKLIIESERHRYTEAFTRLVKEFYLHL